MKWKITIILIVLFFLFSCGEKKPEMKIAPFIRVLLTNANFIKIETDNFVLVHQKGKEIGNGNIFVRVSNGTLFLNEIALISSAIEIAPEKYFGINGKKYRGNLEVLLTNNTAYFINIIDIESYLYSVVPSEVYPSWEIEVLKAQAIVSRTYALYELSFSRKKK